MPSGFTSTTPDSLVLNVGVLSVNGVPLCVTQGGVDFDPGRTDRDIEFDGARATVEGMEYPIDYKPTLKGAGITLDSTFMTYLEPGGSVAGGITTPIPCGTRYTGGDYMDNVTYDCERGDGSTWSVKFAKARIKKWTLDSKDKKEAVVKFEIHAILPAATAATSTDTCPYTLIEA